MNSRGNHSTGFEQHLELLFTVSWNPSCVLVRPFTLLFTLPLLSLYFESMYSMHMFSKSSTMEGPRRTKLSSALSANRHQHCSAGTTVSVFSFSADDGHTSQNTMLVLQLLDLSLFKPHVIIEEDFAHLSLHLPHLSLLLPILNCSIRICIISGSLHLAASKLRAKGEGLPP